MTQHEYRATDDEIVGYALDGRRIRLFPPVLGTLCKRCGVRADDVCFIVDSPAGLDATAGLCATCLLDVLDVVLAGSADRP